MSSYTYFFYSVAKSTVKTTAFVSSRSTRAVLLQGVASSIEEYMPVVTAVSSRSTRARAKAKAPATKTPATKAQPKKAPVKKALPKKTTPKKAPTAPSQAAQKSS